MRIERILKIDDGPVVKLYLEGPNASEVESEFYCIIGLHGEGVTERAKIYGVDQFQALILSIRHLHSLADKVAKSIAPQCLTWEGGNQENNFGLNI